MSMKNAGLKMAPNRFKPRHPSLPFKIAFAVIVVAIYGVLGVNLVRCIASN